MALEQSINIIINTRLINAIKAIMKRAEVVRNHYKDKDILNYGEMDSYLLAE